VVGAVPLWLHRTNPAARVGAGCRRNPESRPPHRPRAAGHRTGLGPDLYQLSSGAEREPLVQPFNGSLRARRDDLAGDQCQGKVPLVRRLSAKQARDVPFVEIARRLVCRECGDKGALLTVRYDDPRRA